MYGGKRKVKIGCSGCPLDPCLEFFQLADNLVEVGAAAKAITSSSYSDGPVMAYYHTYGFRTVLIKPYTLKELETTLGGVIVSV